MNKAIAIVVTTLLIVSMTACNKDAKIDAEISGENSSQAETIDADALEQENTDQEATKPEESITDSTKPDQPKPETVKPETTKPETTKPQTTKPAETKPEVTKPEVTNPTDNSESQAGTTNVEVLDDILNAILKDVDIEIMTGNTEVTSDNFSWYFGIDAIEGAEGLASEAMIGSIAHSIAILRLPEKADADKVAGDIEKNNNPRKWICVEAEKTIVKQSDNIILLIMSFEDVADAVSANFDIIYQ